MVDIPPLFNALQYTVGIAGSFLLIFKAAGGRESNWLFDGASLCEWENRAQRAVSVLTRLLPP